MNQSNQPVAVDSFSTARPLEGLEDKAAYSPTALWTDASDSSTSRYVFRPHGL